MVILKNWILSRNKIYGFVYGDSRFKDGDFIHTSKIVEIDGNIVTTRSGIQYKLLESYTNLLKDIKLVNITIKEYQEFTPKTFIVKEENRLAYLFSGLAAEAGEVSGVYAKFKREDFDASELINKTRKELGDVLWFVFQLSNELGLDIEDILLANKEKLEDRLKRNVLKGSGDNR